MLGNAFLLSVDFALKFTFSKKSFRNTIKVSNSLAADQARYFLRPDLGANCLQTVQQTTKVATSGKELNHKEHKLLLQIG